MPHPADWTSKAWAVLFMRADGRAHPAVRPCHLCWDDPVRQWSPALFLSKKDALAYIAQRFAYLKDPAQNSAGHPMPKPVRVRATISVIRPKQATPALDLGAIAWRPIGTAPKTDAQWLVLLEDERGPSIGCWHRGAWRTRDKSARLYPTHWMPLPAINEGRDD